MAFGAAFYAANMSQSFRVRPNWLYDGFDFSIILQISNLNETDKEFKKDITLFEKMIPFGTRKAISFEFNENLKFDLIIIDDDGNEIHFK